MSLQNVNILCVHVTKPCKRGPVGNSISSGSNFRGLAPHRRSELQVPKLSERGPASTNKRFPSLTWRKPKNTGTKDSRTRYFRIYTIQQPNARTGLRETAAGLTRSLQTWWRGTTARGNRLATLERAWHRAALQAKIHWDCWTWKQWRWRSCCHIYLYSRFQIVQGQCLRQHQWL